MPTEAKESLAAMDEAWTDHPHSGGECIRATFNPTIVEWGGWYFLNGVLSDSQRAPEANWGATPSAGIDLSGSTDVTFWARGKTGRERVNFLCLGVGRDAETGRRTMPYPDSDRARNNGPIQLSTDWTQYRIRLRGADLTAVLGGFAWTCAANQNPAFVEFYLDDIRYEGIQRNDPRFLISYATTPPQLEFDLVMRNVAYTYDNAVAGIALLACGETERALLLAKAFLLAMDHDRCWDDGRLRNAYQGGHLFLPKGWRPFGRENTVRLPGWFGRVNSQPNENASPKIPGSVHMQWCEDEVMTSTTTGNLAWAMLFLLAVHQKLGDEDALQGALRLGQWITSNCKTEGDPGGYTGGVNGECELPDGVGHFHWKSTEHALDLACAFERLAEATGDSLWHEQALHACQFTWKMWDERDGKFWTGTTEDGRSLNTYPVPLDPQSWSILAFGITDVRIQATYEYALGHVRCRAEPACADGFDYNMEDGDGIWYEGTAQMALACRLAGNDAGAEEILQLLRSRLEPSGALPAADRDGLTTGFKLHNGEDQCYFHRAHIGATAWYILAEQGINPFWYGSSHR